MSLSNLCYIVFSLQGGKSFGLLHCQIFVFKTLSFIVIDTFTGASEVQDIIITYSTPKEVLVTLALATCDIILFEIDN